MRAIVDKETWMLPEVAKDLGFVDDVVESMKAVAFANFKSDNMEDKNSILSAIENLGNKISGMFKAKNENPQNMTDTLDDGRKVTVQSEDGDWVGKPVTLEDGSPLPAGTYTLASKRTITVDEGGIIADVKEPEATTEKEPENTSEMEAQKKLEAANARIKELESALEAQTANATKAEAKVKSIEAKATTAESQMTASLKEIKAELDKIKNTTVGDTTPPAKATKLPFEGQPQGDDQLAKFFKRVVTDVRNTD
jgi:hypothetical protein